MLVASVLSLLFLMTGLTTEALLTNDPESVRAERALDRVSPPSEREDRTFTDYVVVRSEEHTVDDQPFRAFVTGLVERGRGVDGALNAVTYYEREDPALVSADRHAMLVPMLLEDEDAAGGVVDIVDQADGSGGFAVVVTGNYTFDHDFNVLSEATFAKASFSSAFPPRSSSSCSCSAPSSPA